MHGVRNSSWNPTLFVLSNKNSDLKMKKREKFREERGLIKSPLNAVYSSFACCSPSLPVYPFFFLSLSLCVLLFFVYLPAVSFYSSCACLSLFIGRFQSSCSLIFLSTDQIVEQFSSVFRPQLLNSCWVVTHFSAFQTHFHQTVSLTFWWCHFLIRFSVFLFFLFYLICVYLLLLYWAVGYERGSYYYYTFFFFWVVLARCRPYMTTLFRTYAIV